MSYWRKVNCIHNWFVENVQGGNDNCDRHYVSDEKIKELVEEIDNILSEDDPKTKLAKAEANLPNTEGFFFGSQEYDKYYLKTLNTLRNVCKPVWIGKTKWQEQVNVSIASIINHLGNYGHYYSYRLHSSNYLLPVPYCRF